MAFGAGYNLAFCRSIKRATISEVEISLALLSVVYD